MIEFANGFQREKSAFLCDSGVLGKSRVSLYFNVAYKNPERDSFEDPALALALSCRRSLAQHVRRLRLRKGILRARFRSHDGLQRLLRRLLRSDGGFLREHQMPEYHAAAHQMKGMQQRLRNAIQMAPLPRRGGSRVILVRLSIN